MKLVRNNSRVARLRNPESGRKGWIAELREGEAHGDWTASSKHAIRCIFLWRALIRPFVNLRFSIQTKKQNNYQSYVSIGREITTRVEWPRSFISWSNLPSVPTVNNESRWNKTTRDRVQLPLFGCHASDVVIENETSCKERLPMMGRTPRRHETGSLQRIVNDDLQTPGIVFVSRHFDVLQPINQERIVTTIFFNISWNCLILFDLPARSRQKWRLPIQASWSRVRRESTGLDLWRGTDAPWCRHVLLQCTLSNLNYLSKTTKKNENEQTSTLNEIENLTASWH